MNVKKDRLAARARGRRGERDATIDEEGTIGRKPT
jgi:hypothetical protein